MIYRYVVAVKDYDSKGIHMDMVLYSKPAHWKTVYLDVVGEDYFGEDENHKKWIENMPFLFEDAKPLLREGGIDVEIMGIVEK